MKILLSNCPKLRNAIALFGFVSSPIFFADLSPSAFAQITPDNTLPNSSVVNQGSNTFTITGGTTANTNLFHSFSEFAVPTNTTALFNNANNIQNIITRITGSSISNIDGLLKANGSANLFLINPNGIIFGQNAKLDIGGSFLATTANNIKFLDGSEFPAKASNQTTSPLLMMSVPVGLQFGLNGESNGAILAQGNGNGLAQPDFFQIFHPNNPSLNVQSGRTLALVGGDVTLRGANLTANSGRIELGSVAGNGFVAINQSANGWILNYDNASNLGNIRLEQASLADTSGINGGGSIQVQGKQITLDDGSVLLSSSVGKSDGGEIFVRATELLAARGESTTPFPSGIFTDTGLNAAGAGSNISVTTQKLELTGGGKISANTLGAGNAGNIKINAGQISLSGRSRSIFYASGLFSQVFAAGNSGNITVTTDSLQVSDSAQITTTTNGNGNAGNIDITAKNISLIGSPLFSTLIATSVGRGAMGSGGILKLTADSLSISNGAQVSVGTAGSGSAGSLLVNAKLIDIAGQVARGRSGLFASAIFGTGNGGDIVVNSDRLILRDGGLISASNFPSGASGALFGTGSVGNITISAPSILLDKASININSAGGDRGNIDLISQLLELRNGSNISTNALGKATGGNITINSDFLVAVPTENSDITANALNNFGGRINITAKSIFGFQTGDQSSLLSDITATSALGSQFNGVVEIQSPDSNLNRGLVKLPENLTDANKQIVAACERFRGNELIVTGRGGNPSDATQPIASQSIWQDLRWSEIRPNQLNASAQNSPNLATANVPPQPSAIQPFPKIEAQGWESNHNGHLKLLAVAPVTVPAWHLPTICAAQ